MEINICLSSDNNYAQHLGVTIASILKNAKKSDDLHFYILDGGINKENKEKLLSLKSIKNFQIEFISIDPEKFENCPLMGNYITMATYYRFMIPTLLPNLDKILYLDCDMVINESLAKLYSEDIEDYWIAGVEDLGYYQHRRILKRETESFYINAGLILINLKKWRKDGIEEKLFKFAAENKDILVHQDQDVINMVLSEKSKPLDLKWNVQDSFYRAGDRNAHPDSKLFKKAKKNPAIIHFTGKAKPWSEFLYLPGSLFYLRYLHLTPWKASLPGETDVYKACFKSMLQYFKRHPFFLFEKKFQEGTWTERKQLLFRHVCFAKWNL